VPTLASIESLIAELEAAETDLFNKGGREYQCTLEEWMT
jgi:hypothetical protein